MYAGHAAIATLVKGKRPRLPLALLIPVAFGPDWIDVFSHVVHHPNPDISHSLVSVGICSLVAALCVIPFYGGIDAVFVGATYASHWLADWVTGIKPTWPGGPDVGLHLYTHAFADFMLESAIVVGCWLVYRASLRPEVRNVRAAYLMPVGLIVLQAVFAVLQTPTIE